MKTSPKIWRDRFSGHWIIEYQDFWLDCYRGGRWSWDIRPEGKGLHSFVKLDKRSFFVQSMYKGHVIPDFATLRAGIKWFETIDSGGKFEEWP